MKMASKSVGFEGISGISKSFAAVAFSGLLAAQGALALDQERVDARYVVTQMTPEERASYIFGVVEGLAFARYQADGHAEGMDCVYDWLRTGTSPATLRAAFEEWPDAPPGAVIGLFVDRACPR